MKVTRIEVTPHARSPIGSHAVIKLVGVSRLEGPATFRLEPLTKAGQALPGSWPNGDLKPLGIRAGSSAVELLIGPDIVKAEPLKPGTPVRFTMPSAAADIVIEWPELTGEQIGSQSAVPALTAPAPTATTSHSTVSPTAPNDGRMQGLARLQSRGVAARSRPPVPQPAESVALAPAPEVNLAVKPGAAPSPPAPSYSKPSSPASSSRGYRQRVEAEQAAAARRRSSSWLPHALSIVIIASLLVTIARIATVDGSGVTLYSVLYSAVTGEKQSASVRQRPRLVLSEILEVGNISPAGVDASGMTRRQALERANAILGSAKTPADRLEVAFWLRKALSSRLAEPRLVWAVTQLGAAYASTDDKYKPNYEAARLLWSWAVDAGDAQAACFLGRLYEQGLGVPLDIKLARKQYLQARHLGGCPGLDQAMLRVKSNP